MTLLFGTNGQLPGDCLRIGEGRTIIALRDGESRGTQNMIQRAEERGLHVYVHRIEVDDGN